MPAYLLKLSRFTMSLPVMPLVLAMVCTIWLSSTMVHADTTPPDPALSRALQPTSVLQTAEPTGRLIVKYRTTNEPWQSPRGSKRFTRSAWRNQHQLAFNRSLSNRAELLQTDKASNLASLRHQAKRLSDEADIEYASVEYRRYPLAVPNDPLYQNNSGDQFYLYDGPYSMQAPDAWDITTGSSASTIAIVDTGVLPNHPALRGRSVDGLGYDFVSPDAPDVFDSANDGNGRDRNPVDPGDPCFGDASTWHGTAVSSVAAGNSNDSEGFAGVDWNARILHARALGVCGGTDADIIDAIRWSAGLPVPGVPDNPNPANVVNLSLGGETECTPAWQDVINEIAQLNVVFVLAAGNENNNALRSSPANCANIITVGSSTGNGNIDNEFSNYGLKVTIATGGREIIAASNRGFLTSDPDANFNARESGTSFSAALVSGAISLMHSLDPNLGPSAVRALLHESATPWANGADCDLYYCGAGVLDMSRALAMLRDGNFNPDRDLALERILDNAAILPLQQQVTSSVFGYRDIRYLTIQVPQRGLLQVESTSTGDLYGYLMNSQLSVIAMDDDSGESTDFRTASVVDPGTYYLAVERSRHRLTDGELPFSLLATLSADAPNPFSFVPANNVDTSDVIRSETVQINGLSSDSVVTISNGFYSLNGADFSATPATIGNGDRLAIAIQSSGAINTTTTATITVGAYTTEFSATTGTGESLLDRAIPGGGNSGSSSGCAINNTLNSAAPKDPLLLLSLLAAIAGLSRSRMRSITK